MAGGMRAALYIRVSTDDQLEFSPDAQKNALMKYAKQNNMIVLDKHIFEEEGGKSGRTAVNRAKFMEMISVAKTKPKAFDVILIHKFDRFARNREDSIVYKAMLKRDCGIRVISITESIEDDKLSPIIEAMLEAMAEYYSINLAEEVKKGMTEKAKRGGFQTSPSFGYRMEGGQLVGTKRVGGKLTIHPEESEIVKYIYNQYVGQDRSPFQIAKALNSMGVKTKRGNTMDGRGVDYILRNPIYIGKVRWTPTEKTDRNFNHPDSIIEQGKHEPIIPIALFNAAAEKLSARAKKARRKERPLDECKHWLSGLVKCSNCGATLAVANQLKYPSFQCSGYNHAKCNVSHSITIRKIEDAVLKNLSSALGGIGEMVFDMNVARTDSAQDKIKLLEKQLGKIADKLTRAKDAYLEGVDDLEAYKGNKHILEKQKKDLQLEISGLKRLQPQITREVVSQRCGNLVELLTSDCDMQTKQKAIRSIIQKIIYLKPSGDIDIYYYDM